MAKLRPVLLPPDGMATSSSTVRDGAVLPILHLNGYKIANPCFLARIPHEELQKFFEGMGYRPWFVEGDDPAILHQQMASTLDKVTQEIRSIWKNARTHGFQGRPAWPMIVLRTPKGWTCPKEIDGLKCEAIGALTKCPWETWTSLNT